MSHLMKRVEASAIILAGSVLFGGCGALTPEPSKRSTPEPLSTPQTTIGNLGAPDLVDCQAGPFSDGKDLVVPKGETRKITARRQSDHEQIGINFIASGGTRYTLGPENTELHQLSSIGGFSRWEASGIIFDINATSDSIIGDLELEITADCS